MKKIVNIGFVTALILTSTVGYAQQEIVGDESTYQMVPAKKQKNHGLRNFLRSGTIDNPLNETVIQFNPLQILRGEIGFTGEQVIAPRMSAVLSLGTTLSNLSPVSSGHYFPTGSGGPQTDAETKFGSMIGAGVRYYPLTDHAATNGFYLEPSFKVRNYRELLVDREQLLPSTMAKQGQYRFAFNMGMQRWYSNNFSLGYYAGVGINYQVDNTSRVLAEYNLSTGSTEYYWQPSQTRDALWYFSGGIVLGIGF